MLSAVLAEIERSSNIARHLHAVAERIPDRDALLVPKGRAGGKRLYARLGFAELDRETFRLARGLTELGIGPGTRTVLMVRPSLELVPLTFALFGIGAVPVLIDPGMGRRNLLDAVAEVEPEAFIGVSAAHAARTVFPRAFRSVRHLVTIGKRWWWSGATYVDIRHPDGSPLPLAESAASDPAAILFTSGSTGPPKGVLYTHGTFEAQLRLIRDEWGIREGDVDLPAFPLFALFSSALGATVVVPDMDPTRPADVDAAKIVEAIDQHAVTYSFGSPAFWRRIAGHLEVRDRKLPTLRRVFMAGAPVPFELVERIRKRIGGEVIVPYGATESLPVSWISGHELAEGRGARAARGAGTCVGKPVRGNALRIIGIDDGPIASFADAKPIGPNEIGEIVVRGPVVTESYFRRERDTRLAKIRDGGAVWHRMGDVGYLDEEGALWFCGRKAHRVETASGPMYTIKVEAIYNAHPAVFRSALVGVGKPQRPVIIIECKPGCKVTSSEILAVGENNELCRGIDTVLFHPSFPVDIRHNAKIFREKLAVWAERQLAR